MAKTFGIKDAISGVEVEMEPTTYDNAKRILDGISHYENTDYFIIEKEF